MQMLYLGWVNGTACFTSCPFVTKYHRSSPKSNVSFRQQELRGILRLPKSSDSEAFWKRAHSTFDERTINCGSPSTAIISLPVKELCMFIECQLSLAINKTLTLATSASWTIQRFEAGQLVDCSQHVRFRVYEQSSKTNQLYIGKQRSETESLDKIYKCHLKSGVLKSHLKCAISSAPNLSAYLFAI